MALAAGAVGLALAFARADGGPGRRTAWAVLAALTLICGGAIIANPLLGAGVLTMLLVVYFIADGAIEIGASFDIGIGNGGGWLLFGGIVSVLLGCMMWGQYPLSGAYAMGLFLGIKLFFIGLIMITGGSSLKRAVED